MVQLIQAMVLVIRSQAPYSQIRHPHVGAGDYYIFLERREEGDWELCFLDPSSVVEQRCYASGSSGNPILHGGRRHQGHQGWVPFERIDERRTE